MKEVKPHQHGTTTGYAYGCRCDTCKAASSAYRHQRQQDSQFAESKRAYQREYEKTRTRDKQARAEINRRNYQANKERILARQKASPHNVKPETRRLIKDRRRARERNAFVENVPRTEVFERDNWVCHICGKQVDRDAKHPSPESPSIDHVIPLAQYGLHERSNLATAHLICNIRKGARDGF
jgi:5-methylcytosine-specific restriction endonuclease McrA